MNPTVRKTLYILAGLIVAAFLLHVAVNTIPGLASLNPHGH
ncbi:hypothetical protein R8Z50_18100 [Longispora sp. K20-0274]